MSLALDIKRITKEGLRSFWRTKVVSFASVMVMTMSLLVISGLLLLNGVLGFTFQQLQERVDVNIYFYPDTPEEEILLLQESIETIENVRDVNYVSREEAFVSFQERHQNDPLITRSLDELGGNPLGASLNVRAFDSANYESIVSAIESEPAVSNADFVERINYYDNKQLIDRLNNFTAIAQNVAYAITAFFAAVAVLVVISTLRIAIFSSKRDIVVKRLVGAEHRYIRGPFLIMGMLYGVIATVITSIALFPVTRAIGRHTDTFFGGTDVAQFYSTNAVQFFIILLAIAIILGIIGSTISVKKYLRV